MKERKFKVQNLKKIKRSDENVAQENLEAFRSWIQKIEQSTTAVGSRLSAVEKRLSTGIDESESSDLLPMNGRVETLVVNIKKKSARAVARVLDHELTYLYNEMVDLKKEVARFTEQQAILEKTSITTTQELATIRSTITHLNETMNQTKEQKTSTEPFVMHLGAIEIPVELTGIIGGFLAFTIALLVIFGQKEVLLSPFFLSGIGVLLIGVAMVKMIRARSKTLLRPLMTMPLSAPTVLNEVELSEKEDG